MSASCITQSLYLLLFAAVALARISFAARCSFNMTGRLTGAIGDKEKIRLQLHDCESDHWLIEEPNTCALKDDLLLEKGEEKDTGYDVNNYDVLAKLYGKYLCVSFYKYEKALDGRLKIKEGCETICTSKAEDWTTYRLVLICTASRCDGTRKSLKFVVTDSTAVTKLNFLLFLLATASSLLLNRLS